MTESVAPRHALGSLFPTAGPWTRFVLRYPDAEGTVPSTPIAPEVATLGAHRLAAKVIDVLRTFEVDPGAEAVTALRSYEFAASVATSNAMQGAEDALDVLLRAGIRAMIIKGAGIAHAYAKRKWRPYSDADILVHPRDFNSGFAALRAAGWERGDAAPPHRPYFLRFCLEGVNMERGGEDRIDLHHAITPWLWGQRLKFDDLWRRSSKIRVGPRTMRVASIEDNFAIACLHLVSDHSAPGKTLMIWQDLIEMARSADADKLQARMQVLGLEAWAGTIFGAEGTELTGELPSWTRVSAAPPHARRLALLLKSSGANPALEWAARLPTRCLPPYLFGLVFPSSSYLDHHGYRTYVEWWRSRIRNSRAHLA